MVIAKCQNCTQALSKITAEFSYNRGNRLSLYLTNTMYKMALRNMTILNSTVLYVGASFPGRDNTKGHERAKCISKSGKMN